MFESTRSEAGSEANCGSKLVSAIENTTRSVFAASAAAADDASAAHPAESTASVTQNARSRRIECPMSALTTAPLGILAPLQLRYAEALEARVYNQRNPTSPGLLKRHGDETTFGGQAARRGLRRFATHACRRAHLGDLRVRGSVAGYLPPADCRPVAVELFPRQHRGRRLPGEAAPLQGPPQTTRGG